MNRKLYEAFRPICATDALKENTKTFVRGELLRRRRTKAPLRLALAGCAAAVLVLCGIGGYNLYATPVSYISVDVNPSVELELNRLDRVVGVTAYNDDGKLVLNDLALKHKPYTQAVELLLADKTLANYLQKDALLSFTVVSDREEMLLAGIQQCRGYAEAQAECHTAQREMMDAAHHNGLSTGKYQAFLELSQYEPAMTAQDCHGLSMGELRSRIRQHTDGGEADSMQHGGMGNGHHGGKGHR